MQVGPIYVGFGQAVVDRNRSIKIRERLFTISFYSVSDSASEVSLCQSGADPNRRIEISNRPVNVMLLVTDEAAICVRHRGERVDDRNSLRLVGGSEVVR